MQIDRILGNVGVLYVGAYNSSTQYEYLNCVTYNGSSYVCVNQNGVTGVTPGTTNDWQLSAQKGDTGGQGIQGEQGIQGATGNGIQSIEKTSSSGLTDTYTIAFTDGSSTTFEVENGKGIVSIEKTSTEGNVDTYTITYNDDTTFTFIVTNGEVTNEELQQALEQERVISDGKYARALKTPVTDVESTQIYVENDVVDDLVINGVELTQVVTENSPSLDNPSEVKVASEQNITINETNITISLTNSAIGQYADTIDRENNVQNKVIQELILTGNEDFKNATYEPGEGFYAYYIKLNMLKLKNIKTFCNYFKQHNEAGNIQEECFTIPNTGNIVFIVQNYTTIKEFKTKLQELYELGKPVKVYYVAETPTTIPLSEEVKQELDKFKLYEGLNNVSIDNGTLSFKYNKSLLRAFEEQSELSASLLERIQALEQAQVNQVGGN